MKILFLDTETTGTDPQAHGIIQIAGTIDNVESDGKMLKPTTLEQFDLKCQPFRGKKIADEAMKLQGLTKADLEARRPPHQAYIDLIATFDKHIDRYNRADKFLLVGQNPKFDYDFMDAWFKDNSNKYFYAYVDYHLFDIAVFTTAFRLLGKLDLPNTKLETVCKHFGITLNAHDAMADMNATRTIFYAYCAILSSISGRIA